MWRDSVAKRRSRYLYLLEGSGVFYDVTCRCLGEWVGSGSHSNREQVIQYVSACVLAPAMNAYIIWVLKAALKKDISRLYFLARDGYFMYTTAKTLCERLHLPIDCRYLSCSRYSIRIPMFHFNMGEAFDYIVRGGIDVTLDKVLNRAGLSDQDKADVVNDIGTEFAEDVIPYADLEKLRTRLEASEVFISAVKEHSEAAFPKARDYLEQEGLFDDVSYAFVDSGWTGSMQKVLGQLLDKCGQGRRLHGFYWGLYELPADVNADDYECFYFGPAFGTRRKVGFSNCLYESIFSAPHGMTLGYERRGKRTEPVYADIRDENKEFNDLTGKYLGWFTEALADFALSGYHLNKPVSKDDDKNENSSENVNDRGQDVNDRVLTERDGLRVLAGLGFAKKNKSRIERLTHPEKEDVLRSLLDTFMGTPARHEAVVYGSLPFSDDVLDENEQQVAAEMTREELDTNHPFKKIMILTGISKQRIRESAWYEGSVVRNGADVDKHLRAYRMYKWMLYGKKEVFRLKGKYINK